jgi:tRNA U34 5-methylaminomethyl-2-thiouridine-forming methyltransferase MnmC
MDAGDMARALGHFPELAPYARALLAAWTPQSGRIQLPDGPKLEVITGDARETLLGWDKQADAWFLDGFSPAKNPELWEPALLRAVSAHTKAGGTAATYSAAGAVRQALSEAGFEVTRVSGFGRKRHMTRARMPDAE